MLSELKPTIAHQFTMIPPISYNLNTKIIESEERPIFICAPPKMGKSHFAMAYAQSNYELDQVLWIDAANSNFNRALESGALSKSIQSQRRRCLSELKLVILDGIEQLNQPSGEALSAWLKQNQEDKLQTIVISCDEQKVVYQYLDEYCLIGSEQLKGLQDWNLARKQEVLSNFFSSEPSSQILSLAALMMLMRRGIVDNFRDLGYAIPAGAHIEVKSRCPLIEIDEATGYFDTGDLPFFELSPQLMKHLAAAQTVQTNTSKPSSEEENCFERLTQMSTHLFERGEKLQSQQLLQLAATLLTHDDAGYPLECIGGCELPGKEVEAHSAALPGDDEDIESATIAVSEPVGGEKDKFLDVAAVRTLNWVSPERREESVGYEIEPITIRLFGDFEVLKGGKSLENKELHRQKVRAVLVHLALNMGRGMARDLLLDKIWPEMDFLRAKDNFYTTWSRLTRILKSDGKTNPYLSNNRGICKLEKAIVRTDVEEFERLSRVVLLGHGSVQERIDCVYRIEQLYRGDLLSGCAIDSYIDSARRRYSALLVDVLLAASELFCASGNQTSAVWFAQKAYDTDSEREDVYRVLMSVQDRAGQRTSALKTYFDCKRFLGEELGILPSQKTIDLYQELIVDHR